MPKYSKELKIKVVKEYLKGKGGGLESISNKFSIPKSTIKNWINKYNIYGLEELENKPNKTIYTSKFKLSVLQYREVNNSSYKDTANHFDIPNPSIIANWNCKYKAKGLCGLENPIGRPSKNMNRKNQKNKPLNESEREELIRLREEVKYLKLKEVYEKKLEALLLEEELKASGRRK